MKTECILELMKEKKYIKINETGMDTMPMMYILENLMGKEFGQKLFEKIMSDDSYIISVEKCKAQEFIFCKTEDIDKWLKRFNDVEQKEILWDINCRIDSRIEEYLKTKNFEMKRANHIYDAMTITNCKIRDERLAKEKAEKEEALELLEAIL